MSSTLLNRFDGGLNLRDSPNELALNETPAATNWTLDERGTGRWRKGCTNVVALPGVSGKPAYIFYSGAIDQWLCVRETAGAPNALKLHTRPGDLSGSWTDRGQINGSLTGSVAFVEFPGNPPKVVISAALDLTLGGGIYTWTGSTLTQVSTTIGVYALALWQNCVWGAGYPVNDANGNVARLFRSAVGDPAIWAVASGGLTVDIREKDAARLTALGIASGSLIVFKKRSTYRINDPSTGNYSTIDASQGCIGPLAVPGLKGKLYPWAADGLYACDGIGPLRSIGDKVRPLFATDPAIVGGVAAIAGGRLEDRLLYAYPSTQNGNNDRLLEFDPVNEWLMKHELPAAGQNEISSFASKETDLYAAVLDGDDLFKVFTTTPGSDDGTAYTGSYRTPWLQPSGGKLARILRAQLEGLLLTGGTNTLKLRVYKDWDLSSYDEYDLSADLRGGDANDQQETAIIRSLGHARSFAFEFVVGTAAGDAAVRSLGFETVTLER